MPSWELKAAGILRALRLESIRSKILAFAVLATLIPSFSTAWLAYRHYRQALAEKLTEQLGGASQQAAREVDLWLKERLLDLRVFASSYEVTENVERGGAGRARLVAYLGSVRRHFPDYPQLAVLTPSGQVVALSDTIAAPRLPEGWAAEIRAGAPAIGPVRQDSAHQRVVQDIVSPVVVAGGRVTGAIAATVDLGPVARLLAGASAQGGNRMLLTTSEGRALLGAGLNLAGGGSLPLAAATELGDSILATVQYTSADGEEVLGLGATVSRSPWLVVAELPLQAAFAQARAQRNTTLLVVGLVLMGVGGLALLLVLLLVRPLTRLTEGARRVAGGDLDVALPVTTGGEVGYLTEVFNGMVGKLRDSRLELERLTVTDGLTGLYNRRHLKETIAQEFERARRHAKPVAILMVDVDHFKRYNDANGHLAGDEVLVRVAALLRESIRTVDRAVRYGGEEMLVLLPETAIDGAVEVAERIRARLADERFAGGAVTISVGAAAFPAHGESPEALIMSADAALYEAKHHGRNQVRRAGVEPAGSGAPG
ncbi:MAG: diguanylate cyclase [Gemmatimonadetes bacterium]|nr:diguanylate cyclase [Gemmatimonadota bacterium]